MIVGMIENVHLECASCSSVAAREFRRSCQSGHQTVCTTRAVQQCNLDNMQCVCSRRHTCRPKSYLHPSMSPQDNSTHKWPHPLRLQHSIAQADQVQLGHPVVVHSSGQQVDGIQELSQQLMVGDGRLLGQAGWQAGGQVSWRYSTQAVAQLAICLRSRRPNRPMHGCPPNTHAWPIPPPTSCSAM